jgi:hypothetical protein
MDVRIAMRFDAEDRLTAVFIQPADQGLFDHVVGAALLDTALGHSPSDT